MTGDPLPDRDHVSRYCTPRTMRDGRVLFPAFRLRPSDAYLSVNWLEYFGAPSTQEAVNRVRAQMLEHGFSIRPNGRFAVLRVDAVKRARQEVDGMELSVEHQPTPADPSHSGIGGYTAHDRLVAVALSDLVTDGDLYPGRL